MARTYVFVGRVLGRAVVEVDLAAWLGLYRGMETDPACGSGWPSMTLPDDREFSDYFRREFERLVRTVYLVLHDQQSAEDVAQDAFGQLYLNWAKVSRYDNPQAWLRRVAIRMAVRVTRREDFRRALTQGQVPRSLPKGRDFDLEVALRALPAQQRAAVALHYYEDLSAEEVGELLGCSASTVRTHLLRARARLAVLLADEEVDHAE